MSGVTLDVDSSTMASSSTGTVAIDLAGLAGNGDARKPLATVTVNGVLVWSRSGGAICTVDELCGLSSISAVSVHGISGTSGTSGVVEVRGVQPQQKLALALAFGSL
jgi:hypothetical protein